MLLYLIRHGETDWNRDRRVMGLEPLPLNDRGRETMELLARALAGEAATVVYTSTVVRARESAEILSQIWGAEVREEPRLNESPYERWIGMTYDELRDDPDFKLYTGTPTRSRFSESEGMEDIQERALAAVERILDESNGGRAAAVSHSDVIKPVVAHYLGMPLDLLHILAIANASATLLDLGGRIPRLRYLNFAPWRWPVGGDDGG
jgi:broad specificity phosphatase PhoE